MPPSARLAGVELSALDEARFGIRTAKGRCESADDAHVTLQWCRDQGVRLLIARCPMSSFAAIHALESAGGRLMDVLGHWMLKLVDAPLWTDPPDVESRVATVADDAILSEAAALVFGGYHGHYHADPRLDRAACDAAYVSWARRCLNTPDAADNVLMFFQRGVLVSFVTMRLVSADEGEVVLGGVLPSAQGRGLWRPTLGGVLRWSEARGARRVIASTQVTNVASQRIWTRMGFSPVRSEATLHVWFD